MKDQAQIDCLRRIYRLERRSFVRFLAESSGAIVLDAADGKAQGFLDAWAAVSKASAERLERLLISENEKASEGSYPLNFAIYNMLQAAYLVAPLGQRMSSLIELIEAEKAGLGAWPAAESAVKELLESHRTRLGQISEISSEIEKARAEIPSGAGESSDRGPKSANWW